MKTVPKLQTKKCAGNNMGEVYFEANTFGIGQLITQRKMFFVPEHQRNFAWTQTDVEMFVNDILQALQNNSADYFIGLIVLLGPQDNKWKILDGQQRLVTTTMIYSAIREWLWDRGFEQDAKQIEDEFIAVRVLGGEFSPRLVPNVTNKQTYFDTVVKKCPSSDMEKSITNYSKNSSNRLLLEANLLCRRLLNDYLLSTFDDEKEFTNKIYKFASYLETRVKVVVMDVSSEANAYTIFESLNARGNELAVVDLVKNYIFGRINKDALSDIQNKWQEMSDILEDKNMDDFLKIFWTSQFGRIQTTQLYHQIKLKYPSSHTAEVLVDELLNKSEVYIALDDPNHDIWKSFSPNVRKYIHALMILGNRQVRAPIMAAMDNLNEEELERLIWGLIVLTVRHQVIGRRRTGLLEIYCANLANQIQTKRVNNLPSIRGSLRNFIPTDSEFIADFMTYSESKKSREIYFLSEIQNRMSKQDNGELFNTDSTAYDVVHLYSKNELFQGGFIIEEELGDIYKMLGNKQLVEKGSMSESEIDIPVMTDDPVLNVHNRQGEFADIAVKIWAL